MESKKVPRKRNGYYYNDDKEYVSVTKVLGDVLAKPALYYWSGLTCARIALKEPWLNEKEVMAELQGVVRDSQERGKKIHNIIEQSVSFMGATQIVINESEEELNPYVKAFVSWFKTHKPTTVANEVELYSNQHMYAGRCDYICKINNENWLIDFKTGKAIYKETGLQLAAYQHALKENEIISIDKMGVVLLMSDGGFQFKETTDTIEDFVKVMEVWKWQQRKER